MAEKSHPDLVVSVFRKAVEKKDVSAVAGCAAIVVARPELAHTSLVEDVFVPAIQFLTDLKNTSWTDNAWFQARASEFFAGLNERQAQIVLDNLVYHPKIDHRIEVIIGALAKVAYNAVWRFFQTRFDLGAASEDNSDYEAIPFIFHRVQTELAENAAAAVDIVKSRYVNGDPMFGFRGGRLLSIVFPDCSDDLKSKLLALVEAEGKFCFEFILAVLTNCKGQVSIHTVCQALINCLPEEDQRLAEVEHLLLKTGVVSGEFGMVDAYRQKKVEVSTWKTDDREKIRKFSERFIRNIDRLIAAEQSSAERDLELLKLNWK